MKLRRSARRAVSDVPRLMSPSGADTSSPPLREVDSLNGSSATKIAGDALDDAVVRRAPEGSDAVLVALGTAPGEKTAGQGQVCSRATGVILSAMSTMHKRRIVVVSSYGIGPTRADRPFSFNLRCDAAERRYG